MIMVVTRSRLEVLVNTASCIATTIQKLSTKGKDYC